MFVTLTESAQNSFAALMKFRYGINLAACNISVSQLHYCPCERCWPDYWGTVDEFQCSFLAELGDLLPPT